MGGFLLVGGSIPVGGFIPVGGLLGPEEELVLFPLKLVLFGCEFLLQLIVLPFEGFKLFVFLLNLLILFKMQFVQLVHLLRQLHNSHG